MLLILIMKKFQYDPYHVFDTKQKKLTNGIIYNLTKRASVQRRMRLYEHLRCFIKNKARFIKNSLESVAWAGIC